ncbi:MAG: hypothetical protein GF341_09465 [candidate division Zixibacteria bacterium]|nr:hypothetical protein [candidate division Zixibacteria bacterium]
MSKTPQTASPSRSPKWPVIVVIAVLAATFLGFFAYAYSANDGTAVFALDDPYIHLAMARNLAEHGVWGVTPDGFTATSSAPLYTLILAILFLITGPTTFWSWFLAAAGGMAVAALIGWRLAEWFPNRWIVIVAGLWAAVVAGVPESMFTGLEHMLHAVSMLIVAHLLSRYAGDQQTNRKHDIYLLLALFVAGGLRYESLFAAPFVFGYVFWQGRRSLAVRAVIAAVIPAVVMGIVQLVNGAMILPNSLLVKGVAGHGGGLGYLRRFLLQIDSPFVSVLLILAAAGLLWAVINRQRLRDDPRVAATGLFLTVVLFQALFAQLERRYVPYLVALGIWAVIPWIGEWAQAVRDRLRESSTTSGWRQAAVWAVVLCLGVFPFADRIKELDRLPGLGHDVYLQQYQVARFFSSEYSGQTVALNDIGTTAWAGENRILDLWGLGDGKIAWKRFRNSYTTDDIRQAARRADVAAAAVYLHWFAPYGGLPPEWTLVGVLQLPPGVQTNVAGPQVMFYAPSATEARILSRRLKAFAATLPEEAIFQAAM